MVSRHKEKAERTTYTPTCIPFSPLLGPKLPISRSIFLAGKTKFCMSYLTIQRETEKRKKNPNAHKEKQHLLLKES